MATAIPPKSFNFSELTENTKELDQLKPTIMSYLPPEDQVSLQPFWGDSFDSDLGLFARIQSIVGLAFHEIASLNRSNFPFPIVLKRFNEELDPLGRVLGSYLNSLLRLECSMDSKIAFLKTLSPEVRSTIPHLGFRDLNITDNEVTEVFKLCPHLPSLDVSYNKGLSGQWDIQIPNKLKSITLLVCENLNNNALEEFFRKTTVLERLTISSSKITGHELLPLDLSKIKKIYFYQNLNLDS
ncbi:MAG: hypothetical protein PVI40_09295, partial [Chlamydiota bacterium]